MNMNPGQFPTYKYLFPVLRTQTPVSDMDAAKRAADAVRRLIKDIMIPSLPALGVDEKTLEKLAAQMAKDAIASGTPGNNPRQATKDEIVALYRLAYAQ